MNTSTMFLFAFLAFSLSLKTEAKPIEDAEEIYGEEDYDDYSDWEDDVDLLHHFWREENDEDELIEETIQEWNKTIDVNEEEEVLENEKVILDEIEEDFLEMEDESARVKVALVKSLYVFIAAVFSLILFVVVFIILFIINCKPSFPDLSQFDDSESDECEIMSGSEREIKRF